MTESGHSWKEKEKKDEPILEKIASMLAEEIEETTSKNSMLDRVQKASAERGSTWDFRSDFIPSKTIDELRVPWALASFS